MVVLSRRSSGTSLALIILAMMSIAGYDPAVGAADAEDGPTDVPTSNVEGIQVSDTTPLPAVTAEHRAPWGYSMDLSAPYDWLDARPGQNLTPSLRSKQGAVDKDEGFVNVALPWTFNFYGVDYTSIYVGANGYLGFDPGSSYDLSQPPGFPSSNIASQKLLALFWTDLIFEARGAIYAKSFAAPDRFAVQYWDATCFCAVDKIRVGYFELVLFRDGTINFQYQSMHNDVMQNLTGLNDGDGNHYNVCAPAVSCAVVNGTTNLSIGFYRPATLGVLGRDYAPAQVPQGTHNVSTVALEMSSSQGSINVVAVDAHLSGNLSEKHISETTAWHDMDRSGNISPGDRFLDASIFVGGKARFGGFILRVGTTGAQLLFVVNLTTDARAGRVFSVSVERAADVFTNGQTVSDTGFPARSKLTLVLDTIPDGLTVIASSQAPVQVEKGRVNVVMLALVMNATSDWVFLAHLNLTLTGNASEADAPRVGVIYDKDRSGGYSTGDVPLRYLSWTNRSANFLGLAFRVEEPLKEILLLAVNVSVSATEGRAVGLCAGAAGTGVVPPDYLLSFSGGCSQNSTIVGDQTPPEVQAVQITPPPPVKAERIFFTVTFSEVMDTNMTPALAFGLSAPWDQWKVNGVFISGADWRGAFDILSTTGDGVNRVRVARGVDLSGNAMGDDTNASFLVDTVVPDSRVRPLPPESSTRNLTLDVDVNETGSGLARLGLFYRVNGGPWLPGGNHSSSPIPFTAPRDGLFEFYTVAEDTASNVEAAPAAADAFTSIDALPPESRVLSMAPYTRFRILAVPFAATDNGTGIAHVELFFRSQGGVWTRHPGTHTNNPISFEASADGSLEFYTVGVDRAGHREAPPIEADAMTVVDTSPPTIEVVAPREREIIGFGGAARAEWVGRDNVGMAQGTRVDLSTDLGNTWTVLGNASGESLLWPVPGIDTQDAMVRASGADVAGNPGVGTSGLFTIAYRLPASVLAELTEYHQTRTIAMNYTTMHPRGLAITEVKVFGRVGGGNWTELASDTDGDRSLVVTVSGDGSWEFYSQAIDANGDREPAPRRADATTIVDTVRPEVDQASPTGVWEGGPVNITVRFSEPMNATSVERGFSLVASGPPQSGLFEWNADNSTFIWRPVGALPPTVEFHISTEARDPAGNGLAAEFVWRLHPASPPDPWPVIALLALFFVAIVLLVLFLYRRNRMRCKDCKRPLTHGEQCSECREKEELKDKGKMEDGVLVVSPVPPGPNADFGEAAQVREEDETEEPTTPSTVSTVSDGDEPEGEVSAEDAAGALAAAVGTEGLTRAGSPGPGPSPSEEGPEEEALGVAAAPQVPRPMERARTVVPARTTPAPVPSFTPQSPPAPARPEVKRSDGAAPSRSIGMMPPTRRSTSPPRQETRPASPSSPLDQRPPGRVATGPVRNAPEERAQVGPRESGAGPERAPEGERPLSAKERLERIKKMREGRAGR